MYGSGRDRQPVILGLSRNICQVGYLQAFNLQYDCKPNPAIQLAVVLDNMSAAK